MQLIGFLGGMSWESTAEYYRIANELVRDRRGGLHSARCVTYSVDFAAIERMQVEGRWEDAATALVAAGRSLEAAGADLLVLCTNTMHKVADALENGVDLPLLHIGDTTATAVAGAGVRRVGLLGTGFTMAQPFYADRLRNSGLEVVLPSAEDQETVHRIIYDELCLGVVKDESRDAYRDVIRRLVDDGSEGVIYGCTEIELLVGPEDSPVPTFPTTRLHVEAAVERALAGGGVRRPDLP
ncbi:aspartate/glutamate racemase family protein [Nocardioides guangzhouensis]|uniref:Aspartate/glutamate racemase family protein n=1 Tax=Nocardioides guangzhouensis TaxID=2497878 RepID=A0A4Q4ZJ98_9ACTN|nr:aspartate/glutamate racemase family protein [Nocardioides guangzhouensis]RYP88367.1 aspartate/glutamate racemase family protein [Nocardioides guangzhouensis]